MCIWKCYMDNEQPDRVLASHIVLYVCICQLSNWILFFLWALCKIRTMQESWSIAKSVHIATCRCKVTRVCGCCTAKTFFVIAAAVVLRDSSLRDMVRCHGSNVSVLSVDTLSLMQTHGADCISTWLTPWLWSGDNMSQTTYRDPPPSCGNKQLCHTVC